MARAVVLGVDSSTQSTKVVAVDLESGEVLGEGRAPHTGADLQDPRDWWAALKIAVAAALQPDMDVRAISVGGQQHGFVTLDDAGEPVREAPLWNNVAAAADADRLNGLADFPREIGNLLVASFTISKVAHLARTEPKTLALVRAICLPHDYINFRLTGELSSDRGDASGCGWWSPSEGKHRADLLALAAGDDFAANVRVPRVCGPEEPAGYVTPAAAAELGIPAGIPVGPGSGDNMAAAIGIGATTHEMVVSLGTSGTAFAVSDHPTSDPTGEVCGFADASGRFLPLACMLNCTRVVDTVAEMFGIERIEALDRAGALAPGANGLLLMPYLAGERTPNLPDATGSMLGITPQTATADHMLRAAVDGVAAGLAYCIEAQARLGVVKSTITLVGGGSRHATWQHAIADVTGLPVQVRAGSEHVALGAAVQASAIVRGETVAALAERWRPEIIAEVNPVTGAREAFQLERRSQLIAEARASTAF